MAKQPQKSEHRIQQDTMLEAKKTGTTLWRNNTGRGWQGKKTNVSKSTITLPDGRQLRPRRAILLENPRPLRAGLCTGSSDLIGLRAVKITPEMVGQTLAVFCAAEVKSGRKKPTPEQRHFLDFVERAGGIARVIYKPSDLE